MPNPVSLQISLAPPSVRYAELILPHQLRVLGHQVDEVILTLDLRVSPGRRWRQGWEELTPHVRTMARSIADTHPSGRVIEVDYEPAAAERIARRFFNRPRIPDKDLRGGPFYSYFFALDAAEHDLVFHLDSDMLLGGGSPTWVSEAVDLLKRRAEVLCVCPLPGPPTADGSLRDQDAYAPAREGPFRFRFEHFTSRLFLCDRNQLAGPANPVPLRHEVPWWGRVSGALRRRSTFALPERLISRAMKERGLVRIDFLGHPPGLWAIHPVDHDERFLRALPELIARVEAGQVSEAQRGRYNLLDLAAA